MAKHRFFRRQHSVVLGRVEYSTVMRQATLRASLSGTFLRRKDVVSQCLEFGDRLHIGKQCEQSLSSGQITKNMASVAVYNIICKCTEVNPQTVNNIFIIIQCLWSTEGGSVIKYRTCDQKVARSITGRRIIFFSKVNFLCCHLSASLDPAVPPPPCYCNRHVKDPGRVVLPNWSAQVAGYRQTRTTPSSVSLWT